MLVSSSAKYTASGSPRMAIQRYIEKAPGSTGMLPKQLSMDLSSTWLIVYSKFCIAATEGEWQGLRARAGLLFLASTMAQRVGMFAHLNCIEEDPRLEVSHADLAAAAA